MGSSKDTSSEGVSKLKGDGSFQKHLKACYQHHGSDMLNTKMSECTANFHFLMDKSDNRAHRIPEYERISGKLSNYCTSISRFCFIFPFGPRLNDSF